MRTAIMQAENKIRSEQRSLKVSFGWLINSLVYKDNLPLAAGFQIKCSSRMLLGDESFRI